MNDTVKKILNKFLIGVLAVIPFVIIFQIIIFVKERISDMYQMVYGYADSFLYTTLVFAISFSLLVWLGHKMMTDGRFWLISTFESVIDRIPLLNTIYRVIKKVINMFSSHEQQVNKEVVYIEYPKDGLWVPAYVTNKEKDMYVLFVPTSPNPTSGFTVIVHESKVVKSTMNVEQATSFIVSVGVDFDKSAEVDKLN